MAPPERSPHSVLSTTARAHQTYQTHPSSQSGTGTSVIISHPRTRQVSRWARTCRSFTCRVRPPRTAPTIERYRMPRSLRAAPSAVVGSWWRLWVLFWCGADPKRRDTVAHDETCAVDQVNAPQTRRSAFMRGHDRPCGSVSHIETASRLFRPPVQRREAFRRHSVLSSVTNLEGEPRRVLYTRGTIDRRLPRATGTIEIR